MTDPIPPTPDPGTPPPPDLAGEAAVAALPAAPAQAEAPAVPRSATPGRIGLRLAIAFLAALVVSGIAYLWIAVPGQWFSSAQPLAWSAKDLQVTRGVGRLTGDELYVMPNDPSGIVVVSVRTRFSSQDQATVAWVAIDVPDDVEASLLWRNDYKPETLNSMPLPAISGRLLPATVIGSPQWIGHIEGLALAIRGPLVEPIRIRGVTVRPHDAAEVAKDRFREWFAFEGWTGTSINTVTGGADLQDLPLPLLLAAAAGLAALFVAALRRWKPALFPLGVVGSLAVFALGAWLLLDLRWTWNLARQVQSTAGDFAFRGFDERRAAVEDGQLYAFIGKVREVLPAQPARVFVVADSHYFRGRAAYHLSPHRVYFDPRANTIPRPEQLRPGDWILVYQRKGVQFDPSQNKLRWNNLPPVAAELKLATRGAALFQIR